MARMPCPVVRVASMAYELRVTRPRAVAAPLVTHRYAIAATREHTGLEPDQGRGRAPRGHGTPRVFIRREERVLRGEARAAGPKVTYLLT